MKLDPLHYSVDAAPVRRLEPVAFDELMAEQLRHAPWLLLSAALHAIVILLLFLVPISYADSSSQTVRMEPQAPVEEIEEEAKLEEEVVAETAEEPVLQDTEVTVDEEQTAYSEDFTTPAVETTFDKSNWNTAIGLGGGGGGKKFGKRSGGRSALRARGGRDTAEAIHLGLEWLKKHQDADGHWDADDFSHHDTEGEPCDGEGSPTHDVGVTSLALLAFLGDGSTMRSGPYKETVKKAVVWLREQQQSSGLFGTDASHDYIYDHTLAALAMVEAYGLSNYKTLRKYAQRGLDYLESHRNPYGVWRYQPQDNDNDSSVTGWAVMVYKSAQDFDLVVNPQALVQCREWFDKVTDPITGRCGYQKRGEPSSRHAGDHGMRFPPERGEALTAVALMARYFLGQEPDTEPVMTLAADRILEKPPVWNENSGDIDHYYWYYATYALYQAGGKHWRQWTRRITPAVIKTQRMDGNYTGSWDPVGAWGDDGGRVYSTAILVLTLEAYYRYTRVFVR